ncbi:MAG: ABC transporter ATP-binding protein [Alkaliphilus sp.]
MMDKEKQPILDVRNLKMHFTSGRGRNKMVTKAVDGISFQIFKGETFGLVGESGCGKTTTGRAIIRLYNPSDGEIYFNDKLISGKATKALRKEITSNVAMIFQDPIASLNPRMTIKEIIGEGLKIKGVKEANQRLEMVYGILNKVGLTKEHATRYPHEFSGGQRQRIGIARALIIEPSLIIADEPISALDVSIQSQVINLLNELKDEFNLTILFIAHDLSIMRYFSDRIGVMYYGKLVEIADSDELYKNPIHPYTRALLSAIPQPNPISERHRNRFIYDPSIHDYSVDKPDLHEIKKGHFVFGTNFEIENYKRELTIS